MARRLLAILWAALLAGCAARRPSVPYERDLGVASFDAAWRIVYETHPDTTFNGVDWPALRDDLRPRAIAARDREALRAVIRDMLQRLNQSHFALFNQEDAEQDTGSALARGGVGLEVRLRADRVVVTTVDSGGPAAAAGVRAGWIVEAIGGRRTSEQLARQRARGHRVPEGVRMWAWASARLRGDTGTMVSVRFRDPAGRVRVLALRRAAQSGQPVKLGNLPTFFTRADSSRIALPGGGVAGLVRFNVWMVPVMRLVDAAIDAYRELDGVVLDLRGNPGGVGLMVGGLAGHFLARAETLGVSRRRSGSLAFVANPRRSTAGGRSVEPFGGPVALLIDELSGSASEVFAGGLQSLGRVRVFGSTSQGGVLPAQTDRLPNGDVLYHAIADFRTGTGVRLEGRGVVPDEAVMATPADVAAGRDPVLDAALRWMASQRRGTQP